MIVLFITGAVLLLYVTIGLIGTALSYFMSKSKHDEDGTYTLMILSLAWLWPVPLGFFAADKLEKIWRRIR